MEREWKRKRTKDARPKPPLRISSVGWFNPSKRGDIDENAHLGGSRLAHCFTHGAGEMKLVSESLSIDDYNQAVEVFYERGWTDGLPVVLPTRNQVEAMIAYSGRDPQESVGPIPPKGSEGTVEKLAINAVMGGCRPEHFPVVLAAMEAMMDPAHNLNGVSHTTHMCVSLIIVNGPIARELGFNSRDGVFGNGYRANAAVG